VLDPRVLVAFGEDEARRVGADLLVFLERDLDPLRALAVIALADELRAVAAELLRAFCDPLVDIAEEGLRLRDVELALIFLVSRTHEWTTEMGRHWFRRYPLRVDWPEPVERVASYLRSTAAEARIEEFAVATPTAADAARAAGADPAQIVKSLVFDCDGRPIVVLVPGDRRADVQKVAAAAGCGRAAVAAPAQVREWTGFEPGAVAPFPLPGISRVLVDRTLLAQPLVWVGAGSENHLAALAPAELVRLTRAEQIDAIEA
jgi:prolyl-tRNA editing enzyme YbaK/EbsC (Cys-tRNA(Pro) deacylase)